MFLIHSLELLSLVLFCFQTETDVHETTGSEQFFCANLYLVPLFIDKIAVGSKLVNVVVQSNNHTLITLCEC